MKRKGKKEKLVDELVNVIGEASSIVRLIRAPKQDKFQRVMVTQGLMMLNKRIAKITTQKGTS